MLRFWLALAGALIPCLLWLRFFYRRDRYDPEPPGLILKLFLIGALPVAFIAGFANSVVFAALTGGDVAGPRGVAAFGLLAVVIAPITEETLKYLGASAGARRHPAFDEPVDGMVYGVTVGLGFAAAETLDYLASALQTLTPFGTPVPACTGALQCFVLTALLRGFGSALLHASASAVAGYGLTRRVIDGAPRASAVGWVIAAMVLHGLWNAVGFLSLPVTLVLFWVLWRRALRRSPHKQPAFTWHRAGGPYAG